jgi:hypothetical protein
VDLIGKQYSGMVQTGPTMLFINLSFQSAAAASSSDEVTADAKGIVKQVGKVEGITNEVCKLRFDQDVLGDIFGIYTRDDDAEDDEDRDEDGDGDEDVDGDGGVKKKRKMDDSKVHKGKKATSFAVNRTKGKSKSKIKSKSKKK